MRRLTIIICLTIAVIMLSAEQGFALPLCPADRNISTWTNCFASVNFTNAKYAGEFKNGKFYGQGTITHTNGEKYVGEFRDGKIHGHGIYTYPDGVKYVGEYKDDKKNGQGTLTSPRSGGKYVGEFRDDSPNGQGTYTFGPTSHFSGDKYVGKFKNGKFHGQGTYTRADGEVTEGIFQDSKLQYTQNFFPVVTAEQSPPPEGRKQNSLNTEELGSTDRRVCEIAIRHSTGAWESDPDFNGWVSEARKRGLTTAECGNLLALENIIDKDKAVTSASVREAQRHLNALGYDAGPADGISGRRTRAAVSSYQRRQGLPETGTVTSELITRLDNSVYLNGSEARKQASGQSKPPSSAELKKVEAADRIRLLTQATNTSEARRVTVSLPFDTSLIPQMNDITVCAHQEIRDLKIINDEVTKRGLKCTKLLEVMQ